MHKNLIDNNTPFVSRDLSLQVNLYNAVLALLGILKNKLQLFSYSYLGCGKAKN